MATIVLSPFDVANFPGGGGHFWVYMQYAQGLRRLGCEVYWLEQFRHGKDPDSDARALATFFERMERFGLGDRVLLYTLGDGEDAPIEYLGVARPEAEAVLRRADLVLNFHYAIDPRLLACARRTALVDIDPGLTQLWISAGQLRVPAHDVYFTIGETVGTPAARFPDCGLRWMHIRPPVCLELWPYVHDPRCEAFLRQAPDRVDHRPDGPQAGDREARGGAAHLPHILSPRRRGPVPLLDARGSRGGTRRHQRRLRAPLPRRPGDRRGLFRCQA